MKDYDCAKHVLMNRSTTSPAEQLAAQHVVEFNENYSPEGYGAPSLDDLASVRVTCDRIIKLAEQEAVDEMKGAPRSAANC